MSWPLLSHNTKPRPLSLSESIYLADVQVVFTVRLKRNINKLRAPLLGGTIGPNKANTLLNLPLLVADILTTHNVAIYVAPLWLHPSNLRQLISFEQSLDSLQPPPHPHYIEIAAKMFIQNSNPWSDLPEPNKARDEARDLYDCFTTIRERKIDLMTQTLIDQQFLVTSNLSEFERGNLACDFAQYGAGIEKPSVGSTMKASEVLEELLDMKSVIELHNSWLESHLKEFSAS